MKITKMEMMLKKKMMKNMVDKRRKEIMDPIK